MKTGLWLLLTIFLLLAIVFCFTREFETAKKEINANQIHGPDMIAHIERFRIYRIRSGFDSIYIAISEDKVLITSK